MFTLHFIGGVADGERASTEHKPATVVTLDEPTGFALLPVIEHKYGLWVEDGERLYYRPEEELREIASYADDGEVSTWRTSERGRRIHNYLDDLAQQWRRGEL